MASSVQALAWGSIAAVSLASLAPASQKLSAASFNGLRAFPMLKQRPTVIRLVAASSRRPPRISAAADAETFKVVSGVIAEQLAINVNDVRAESKFTDLGADSLDTVEIMMALEEKFDIQLDEDNAEQIVTVQHAADLIHGVVTAKKA